MDINIVKDLVLSLGFPIVVACYLLIYVRKSIDAQKDAITNSTGTLEKAIAQLNITQTKLVDVIDRLCDETRK